MWIITDEEMVKLQNRMNDLWEQSTEADDIVEYVKCANRLIGALDMLMNENHYYKGKDDRIR